MPWRIVAQMLYLDILVSPRASREKLGPVLGGRLKVFVHAPPVEGEANAAIIGLLSKELRVPARELAIAAGESSRRKTVSMPVSEAVLARLATFAEAA